MAQRVLRSHDERSHPPTQERGPSPWDAERVRQLSRTQIDDRLTELAALYAAHTCVQSTHPGEGGLRAQAFLRRLLNDVRNPGFGLLIAEDVNMTACAYGFPLRAGLFEVREIVVPQRVRDVAPHRDWNLARRLQRRLLVDHGHATGVVRIERWDIRTLEALRSWGWRDTTAAAHGIPVTATRRVLTLTS
ncbi:hypothetical protein [Streptomyces sp. BH055]|uniref:hypothetical protein n=1 Tax=Streptomyces sp. BH055 TaxID=3401173 RepID=UPI003BB5E243